MTVGELIAKLQEFPSGDLVYCGNSADDDWLAVDVARWDDEDDWQPDFIIIRFDGLSPR